MQASGKVEAIYRYPVKGLSAEKLQRANLQPGQTILADRRYAIENGPSGFDPTTPACLPKIRFLMLMRNERLARLSTTYEDATSLLVIREGGREVVRGELATPEGRQRIEAFFAAYCADELRGPPRVLEAPGHSFSDVARKVVSIINLASLTEIADAVGAPVHPLRFRANIYVRSWPAWHELGLTGRTIAIGASARLRIVKRIVRCAATEVDPDTGIRDLTIPRALADTFGHMDCGVYGEVIAPGEIAPDDSVDQVSAD